MFFASPMPVPKERFEVSWLMKSILNGAWAAAREEARHADLSVRSPGGQKGERIPQRGKQALHMLANWGGNKCPKPDTAEAREYQALCVDMCWYGHRVLDSKDWLDQTPLHLACSSGNIVLTETLLHNGAGLFKHRPPSKVLLGEVGLGEKTCTQDNLLSKSYFWKSKFPEGSAWGSHFRGSSGEAAPPSVFWGVWGAAPPRFIPITLTRNYGGYYEQCADLRCRCQVLVSLRLATKGTTSLCPV